MEFSLGFVLRHNRLHRREKCSLFKKLPVVLGFALVRLWLRFVRLLSSCLIASDELWERLMFLGQLNVRRMSGARIASVCRLHACASNYRPPILLSFLTSSVMLVD